MKDQTSNNVTEATNLLTKMLKGGKVTYSIEQLLELKDTAIPKDNLDLPERSFYRFDASVMKKMNNYYNNLNNPTPNKKERSGGRRGQHNLHHHNRILSNEKHSRHYQKTSDENNEEEEEPQPEWMEETDFKVDHDFKLYMKSGTHTADDFEREKQMYLSKNKSNDTNDAIISSNNGTDTKSIDDGKKFSQQFNPELESELRKQLEEPEILGPTEEEYFENLKKKESKLEEEEAKGEIEKLSGLKPKIGFGDHQFSLEMETRKQVDHDFMNTMLMRNTKLNDAIPKSPVGSITSESSVASNGATSSFSLPPSLKRTGSQILPDELKPASSPLLNGDNFTNHGKVQRASSPMVSNNQPTQIDAHMEHMRLQKIQVLQMQRMQQIHQMQRMQQNSTQGTNLPGTKMPINTPPGFISAPPGLNNPAGVMFSPTGLTNPVTGFQGSQGATNVQLPPGLNHPQVSPNVTQFPLGPTAHRVNPIGVTASNLANTTPQGASPMLPPGLGSVSNVQQPHIIQGQFLHSSNTINSGPSSHIPPPNMLPSPFREKFHQLQQALMHFQQNGHPPPPQLLHEMAQFHQILERTFGGNRTVPDPGVSSTNNGPVLNQNV